jgi:hypothetical protein
MQLRESTTRGVAGNQVLRLIALLMAVSSPVFSQSGREQTSFGLEAPLRHPVKLPVAVVEQLRVDEDVRDACDTKAEHPDASWFEATTVRLKRGELPALLR